jgi:hypothetical protein
MSFSAHRRNALDMERLLDHRASHARSCALCVAQKYRVRRSVVIELVRQACGVELMVVGTEHEIAAAVAVLTDLKLRGLDEAIGHENV